MLPSELGFHHRYLPAKEQVAPGQPQRTLLLLHGTGGDEHDLLPLGQMIDPAANLLSPRGKVLEQGMPRFFRRVAEGVFDQEDLVHRTHELADFVQASAQAYHFDAAHVIAIGYSNGANIAASMLLLRPEILAGAALLHPMVPFEPVSRPDLSGRRILISAGRNDPIVPPEQAQRLAELLQDCSAQVTLSWWPGGHALTRDEVDAVRIWLA